MPGDGVLPGSVELRLVDGVPLLHPEEQVFTAMLEGWRNQRLARNLAHSTVESQERHVLRFFQHADAYPWHWTPQLTDEWFSDMRAVRHVAKSTVRSYQVTIRGFCNYITDPAYGWAAECEKRFGTHPVQVLNEVNAATHVADSEAEASKRAFTRAELQALFDHADEEIARKRAAGRKGWLPAFRDVTIFDCLRVRVAS